MKLPFAEGNLLRQKQINQVMNQQTVNGFLVGKRVVLIGGSSGIGLATAKAAAAEGAQVIIASSNQQRIDQALTELPEGSEGYRVDLTNEQEVVGFFDQIGGFDHLVYTAGEGIKLSNLANAQLDEARSYFNIRYWGAFMAVKYGYPHMSKDGSIVLTSGIASQRPNAGWSLGASICAAMEGFTRAMAMELAPVRVNAVSPGVVKTNLWSGMSDADREGMYSQIGSSLPVKRVGEAEDIAQTYLYLLRQPFSTGQIITVDGGAVLV
ncbi:SDR family oxidoreductase [Spirosoma sp. HMF4905]|uniref:SDR family oxidoreductase n=1 Tax=Spirosoma arboris TaxID=2682092 RepID=A0A7K1SJ07_9BACT|nr:SDR family oxidoreductase [Spirosoma arboris]MVM33782.1 SDR family oxidoreductase [Spirosoma arboris]